MKTAKVGTKGQIVIPKEIRDELGIRAGETVGVERADGEVRVRRLLALDELQGTFAATPGGTRDLEAEHRRELQAEEERAAHRWTG